MISLYYTGWSSKRTSWQQHTSLSMDENYAKLMLKVASDTSLDVDQD